MADSDTKVVWITMLALKDQRHMVEISLPGLARYAGVSLEACERAIKMFESPDPHSRNRQFEGRKIERRDGGWYVLNGPYYEFIMSKEDRNEYQRIKQKEYRDAKRLRAQEIKLRFKTGKLNTAERLAEAGDERSGEIEADRVAAVPAPEPPVEP